MSVCNVAADIGDCLRADCKVLFCWVFSFATLHLLYSAYYLRLLKQHVTSFAEGKFLRFQSRFVPRKHEERSDRGLEESFLLAPSRRTHALLQEGAYWTVACRGTRGRRSYLVSGKIRPSCLRKSDSRKRQGSNFTANFTRAK
jgi:hypothetical protein